MHIISTIQKLRDRLKSNPSVAFVPIMGNLHQGHLALVRQAREQGRKAVKDSSFPAPEFLISQQG